MSVFGRKPRVTTPAQDELTITVYSLKGGYSSPCPYGGRCPESPGRGLPFVIQDRSKTLVIGSMNAHLEATHGVDGAVPRRIED